MARIGQLRLQFRDPLLQCHQLLAIAAQRGGVFGNCPPVLFQRAVLFTRRAQFLLSGSVVRAGGQLVVEARLVDLVSGEFAFAKRYRAGLSAVGVVAHTLANDLVQVFGGERSLVVAREMTKLHEEFFRGSADGAIAHFSRQPVKGEVVLILPPGSAGPQMNARDALRNLMGDSGLSRREAVKMIAREYGLPVSDVYRLSLDLTGKGAEDG